MKITYKYLLTLTILLFITISNIRAQEYVKETLKINGVERTFEIYIPAIYDGNDPVPLLINMHKRSGNIDKYKVYTDFMSIADTANFILVHPQGLPDDLGRTHWNFNPSADTTDDIGFLEELIDFVGDNYNIDSRCIYSTGFSQGGFMSFYLACNLSHKIAAIGAVGGSIIDTIGCRKGFPMPFIQIHGTDDDEVGYETYKVKGAVDLLAGFNGCNLTPDRMEMSDLDPNDGSTVTKFSYYDCDENAEVVHYRVNGGLHLWPGKEGNRPHNQDIDASVEIWNFVSQFPYDKVSSNKIDPYKSTIFPNPASDVVFINTDEPILSITVTDIHGRNIAYYNLAKETREYQFSTKKFKSNIYLVVVQTEKAIDTYRLLKI